MRLSILLAISMLAICLSPMNSVHAAPILGSTLGFADIGTPTVNTGDINTATAFTVGNLVTTSSNSGIFAGIPQQQFGTISFVLTGILPKISFSNAVFGNFVSTSVTETQNVPALGFATLESVGTYDPGTFAAGMGVIGGPVDAELRISFTQTPAHTGAISASGTLALVPEPSSIVMGFTGFIGFAGVMIYRLPRRRKNTAMA